MTTVNYLDKTDLHLAFNGANFDAASQQAVIDQLIADGLYNPGTPDDGKSVWVESDLYNGIVQPPLFATGGNPQVPGFVQVLEVQGSYTPILTDPALKVIVDDQSHPGTLNIMGGDNPVFIALGSNGTTLNLGDQSHDTVRSSSGNDSITVYSGSHLLIGGSGNDTMTDLIAGGHTTMVSGSGDETFNGVQGDTFLSGTMPSGGHDVFNISDGPGNSSMALGTGQDTVNFYTSAGNDTISNGGLGTDTVNLATSGQNTNSLLDIKPGAAGITVGTGAETGNYTVNFIDGQSLTLIGHGVSSTQTAFVLEFKEGNINLKGGS